MIHKVCQHFSCVSTSGLSSEKRVTAFYGFQVVEKKVTRMFGDLEKCLSDGGLKRLREFVLERDG